MDRDGHDHGVIIDFILNKIWKVKYLVQKKFICEKLEYKPLESKFPKLQKM